MGSVRMNKKKKKYLAAAGACVFLLLAVVLVVIYQNSDNDILFYVDEEPVYKEEAEFVIQKERLTVRNHIMTEHDVDADDFSWDNEYDGKKAMDYMQEKIFEECKKNKTIEITAREMGVIEKIDYPSILKMNEEDTKVRGERVDNGEVIYGNTSYRPEDYYDYVLSNLEQQTFYRLVEEGRLEMTESEIDEVYEEHKEALIEAGTDDKGVAETIGLQQKYSEYIQQRADKASIKKINKGGMQKVLEECK